MKIFFTNLIKSYLKDILILASLILLIVYLWFSKGLIFAGGEEGIPFYDLNKTNNLIFYTWQDTSAGYPTQLILNRIPYFKFLNLFYLNGFSGALVQAIHFFIIMIFGAFSMYFLLRITIGKDLKEQVYPLFKYVPLIGAVFYLLNPFSMTQVWGRGLYLQFFPFALLPFFLLMFVLGLKSKNLIFGFLGLVASVFLGGAYGNPSYIFSQWIIVSIYLLFYLFKNRERKEILFALLYFAFMFLGWVWVHMWWILPFIKIPTNQFSQALGNVEEHIGTLKGVSKDYQLHSLLRLIHEGYFYRDEKYGASYPSLPFLLISLIIPICVFFSYKTFKKFKSFLFFGMLFLFSLFICLGSNLPTGPLFVFLFKYFPVFQSFRNPFEKFGIVFTLAYASFFAIGVVVLSYKIGEKLKRKTLPSFLLPFFLFLVFGVFLWPIWTGQFAGGIKINPWVQVPGYYAQLDEWLNNQKDDGRIIHLPINKGDGLLYSGWQHPYQGIEPGEYLFTRPSIGKNGLSFKPYYSVLLHRFNKFEENIFGPDPDISQSEFKSDKFYEELAKLNVRYIILHYDVDPVLGKIGAPEGVADYLNQQENIKKIQTFGKLDVYQVDIPENVQLVYSPDIKVEYKRMNTTQFLVNILDSKTPFDLYLLENFDPNWEAYIGSEKIKEHDKVFSYANKWRVQEKGDFNITIKYKPQDFVFEGIAITKNALLILGLVSGISFVWKLKKN